METAGGAAAAAPARPGPALAQKLGIAAPPLVPEVASPHEFAPDEAPTRPRQPSMHEVVAMVSSQPLAYLRMPTRPPPAGTAETRRRRAAVRSP